MTVKKILAVLTAAATVVTSAAIPVLAEEAPVMIELPNGEVVEYQEQVIEAPDMPAAAAEENTYYINDVQDFKELDPRLWYSTTQNTFIITDDINLEDYYPEGATEAYAIQYFYAHLEGQQKADGTYPTISGFSDDSIFIWATVGGSIENLNFDYGTSQVFMSYQTATFSNLEGYDNQLRITNVTVNGDENIPTQVGNNYAPFVFVVPNGGLVMTNCTNTMDMVGTTYSSIFYGYHPFNTTGPIVFDGCVNEGDLTTDRAGMFFGNSTGLDNYIGDFDLTIKNCKNIGSILGTTSAYYLCAAAAQDGEFTGTGPSAKIESILQGDLTYQSEFPNINPIDTDNGKGKLGTFEPLTNFNATWIGDNISIIPPVSGTPVDHYIVQVGAYVNVWKNDNPYGTQLFVVSDDIEATEVNTSPYTVALKAYGFADVGYGAYYPPFKTYNRLIKDGVIYYQVTREPRPNFTYSVSTTLDTPSAEAAQMVIVSAYDSNNNLLASIRPEKEESNR